MALVAPVDLAGLVPADLAPLHFIAVGGSGMSGIAQIYADLGLQVSGSDKADSPTLQALRGIRTHVGHSAGQLADARTVVVSSAIAEDNPELVEARARGLRVLHRSAALAVLMGRRVSIAVAGTHGKTTTSAMIVAGLRAAGVHTGFVVGAPIAGIGSSAEAGTPGTPFVAEADESDGSFLQLPREIVVVTNVEADHLDNWGTPQAYAAGFDRLLATAGTAVVNLADPGAAALVERAAAAGVAVVGYGTADAEVPLTGIALSVPGAHNRSNATAAVAVLQLLGIDDLSGVSAFSGTHRRFEPVGEVNGVRVFDDYAHHPTEVAATLAAAREAGGGRVIAIFQPHLFSRTRDQAEGFAESLAAADEVYLLDIYPAREQPIPGVTSALIADRLPGAEVVSAEQLPGLIAAAARPGDIVLTLGAGDITRLGPKIVAELPR
ncbi:UDP-N-acetylmuramate--L-alanine ligase [Naumannella halotolerans]|uniref:UDP-N-acetylmuramate--L-alanine ligase n=1 Tax=Naumannella halotolerans TaxID=993414 RepID=A0A4R7J620_9ACTN|nr:UDP-N-acetylmuramate--L-alanine ligase [Naumannella halotolerans]TDT32812.1 UDP-N-acetylmuramate--alanine ligase [Naumannella halotolerans]